LDYQVSPEKDIQMLKEMREGAKSTALKLILFGLLLLAMTGLALMDVQGMFRRGVANDTVATYGREKLTTMEFDRTVQNILRRQNMKQREAYQKGVPRQILNEQVDNRLFSLAADELGIEIDDTLAAKQIKEVIQPLVEKGMSEKDALQRMLQSYGVGEGQLVSIIKAQIASQQLLGTIAGGAHAPEQLVNDVMKYRHEWRRGTYFRLTAENAGATTPPAEADLKSYYDSIAAEYALPETRTLAVLVLDKNALGDEVKISDDRLKQYYDENISDYKTPENRVIAQAVAQDEASAKAIYDAAVKSKNLEAAAKGKGSYVKPGTYSEKGMPAELSKTAFTGEAGKVLPPLKSPLGWHVLYVEKVIPETVKPFESVKDSIDKELSQDKISEALYQRANKIDDEIAGGKSLSEVAKENNITETVLEKVDVHGLQNGKKPDTKLPLLDKIVENGFSIKQGASSPLIETPDGAFMIVGVKEVFPSLQQPFEKVRPDVLARWTRDHQSKALNDKAAKIMERLKQGEEFGKVSAELHQSVQTTDLVQRGTTALKAKMDDNTLAALFSLGKVGDAAVVTNDNSLSIIRLAERKIQAPEDAKTETDQISAAINRSLKQDLLEQYRASLVAKYDVQINEKLLAEMYTPKDENAETGEE
jgi:peptidyl-prolyl cis-trans isomerase D